MSIKIEMLRCFVTVVAQGSLAEAANALGRTASAVSMMLKQLEDHIGAPLFETARKSRLTTLGRQILDEARREIEHFDRTVAAIDGLAKAERGYVRLSVTPSIAQSILPQILRRIEGKRRQPLRADSLVALNLSDQPVHGVGGPASPASCSPV